MNHVETLAALEQVMFFGLDLLNEAARAPSACRPSRAGRRGAELMLGRVRAEQRDPAGAAEALRRALARPDEWHGADQPDRVAQAARALPPAQTGRPDQARDALRPARRLGRRSRSLLAPQPMRPPAGDHHRRGPLGPGPFVSRGPPPGARAGPVRRRGQCLKCHKAIFQTQHHSRHARTFVRKDTVRVAPGPRSARRRSRQPQPSPTPSTAVETDLEVQTRVKDSVFQTIVDYAFGSGDRGLTLVGHDPENRPFEYRLSHYPDPVGWDVTSGQPGHVDQPALYQGTRITADAVRRCLVCHTTNPYAITTGSGPESADAAIGCERCHGPGGHHLKALAAGADDPAIARPTLADGPAIVGLCSQCHSPRDPNLPLSPGGMESVRFQGTTFTWSRCYTESRNAVDCVTCHDPHRDVETATAWYEARCLDCHSAAKPATGRTDGRARRPARPRPLTAAACPVQPDRGCIDCHMPRVEIPTAHTAFTDHFIRVHRK